MSQEPFTEMLSGGHHNSLGRTLEVVDIVLANQDKLEELYQCYFSPDELVRLRTSNGIRRVCVAHPDWYATYIERFLTEICQIDQASTQWTLAILFKIWEKEGLMTAAQVAQAQAHMQDNIVNHKDWIVLNNTMETLTLWAEKDNTLRLWLIPELERLMNDTRKSVAKRAVKFHTKLS